jgi:hypothetical protein
MQTSENNPYAPPKAPVLDHASSDSEPTAASAPLYTTTQMAVAAFLGSALAGAWLAAANFNAVGQPLKARRTLWLGAGAAIVTIAFAFVLPENFPNSILPLAVAFGVRGIAETYFAQLLREHKQVGGALRSWWRVVGISLLTAAVVFVVVAAVFVIYGVAVGDVSL